ncbi:hypothetical protein CYLTODRAFT_422804 [Cylindrobasidium torrendii FP15055 ss-10]|uniref:HIT-type domain-containing protein n=1 Tax=Cylindrobasidium torrendii FP15055 ss-10 TaxID=1314674 RepID=A0A0D7B948_9AGAR|nr:hypothetical protein CYLTODRAFT_422804 [Cylindrobasidium torrendii FP15055 ss-10]
MTARTTPQLAIETHLHANLDDKTRFRTMSLQRRKRTVSSTSNMSSLSSLSSKLEVRSKADPTLAPQGPTQTAYGAFTPTSPASMTLQRYALHSKPFGFFRRRPRAQSLWEETANPLWDSDSIPSISRTSSYLSDSSSNTASSSGSPLMASPEVPVRHAPFSPTNPAPSSDLNPILASLERKSKLCRGAHCSTCNKPGNDFPRCGRCGEMFCSRECRTRGGKRHICRATTQV